MLACMCWISSSLGGDPGLVSHEQREDHRPRRDAATKVGEGPDHETRESDRANTYMVMYVCIHIYIYMYIERERCMYIYIYIYAYMYVYV